MSVTVKLPAQLRAAAGGSGSLNVDGTTVSEVLDAVYAQHPDLRKSITDDDGKLRRFVNVYVNGEDIRFGDGLATSVPTGGEVQVLPAVAGG